MALIIPYQALLTPMFLMFVQLKLTNSILGLAILHTTIQLPFSRLHHAQQLRGGPARAGGGGGHRRGRHLAGAAPRLLPAVVPAIVTVALFAFITSWNELLGSLVMNKESSFTLPVILAAARTETSLGGTDWGMLQAGVTISIIPCILFYLLLQKYYVSGLTQGALK